MDRPGRVPRAYQLGGVAWLRDGERRFLTDGFGLGKTAQAIWAAETPCMVACPGHLLNHWRREILACRPDARVLVATARDSATRKIQLNAEDADFFVFNVELFRTGMHGWFRGLRSGHATIKTLIVDESHRLRGRNSQQSQGAFEVAKRVPRVYLLTATPSYNQPDDLFAQLRLLDHKRFSAYWAFCKEYLKILETPWGPKILGLKRDRRLKGVFAEYAMGRTREDVAAQLPALQETLIEIGQDVAWYVTYERIKAVYRDKYNRALLSQQAVLQALRTHTQTAKVMAVCSLIQDSCDEHTLIYTYHRDLAYALGHLLKIPVITGDVKPLERERLARSNDFLVATFPSVAEGIDLSHIRNVVYMEHDWQPGMMEQSMNRVYRPGGLHDHVFVYHVVVKNTVDTAIYHAFKRRGQTMEEIVQSALRPVATADSEVA
jgi:SNF2 family DNA or RNA helicase